MTLLRELALSLTILLFFLFSASLVINVRDARDYLQADLESHAQDTATSLGVAIASTDDGDVATIDSMIDAVFDRGYYHVIRFSDMSGKVLVNSEHPVKIEGIPDWFFSLVDLKAPGVSTEVNRGWVPAGILFVKSHPGHAYQNLWLKVRNESMLFAFGLLVAIIGLNIFLRIVLKPLKQLEKQADAICHRRFEIQEQLPKTKDLRQVVEAMNRMAGKLQKLFNEKVVLTEELRRQSVKDPLTGILNGRAFENQVNSALDHERGEAGGSLILINIRGLDALQRNQGHEVVDSLLVDISRRLCRTMEFWPDVTIGHRELSQFAVFLPTCGIEDNKRISEACFRALASLHFFVSPEGQEKLHLASVTHLGECQFNELLEHSEQLLKDLQLQGHNNWQVKEVGEEKGHNYFTWTQGHWQETLRKVFEQEQIDLFAQQAFDKERQPLFREVLARLRLDNELASAQAFVPMVDRFDLHVEFDRAVVNCLVRHMEKTGQDQCYCVNLSPRSFMSDEFFHWLLRLLKKNPAISKRLILETPERILHQSGDQLTNRVSALTATGCQFSLDHFGVATQSLNDLDFLDVAYIKLDSSFVRGITENQGNQFYIRTLAMLASSRDITLLAHGIEHKAEWVKLGHLGVQGGQGYYLAKPAKL